VRRAVVAAVLAALLGPTAFGGVYPVAAASDAKTVRVFAVGPRLSVSWLDTRAHFHDKLSALMDAKRRGAGAPSVVRGAGDVASHLRKDGNNFVALPEDLGLWAAFTGSQGAPARSAKDVVGAVVALLGTYAPQMGYYRAKYPSLATRPLPTRTLALALTDTFGRVAVETYSELAARYHVWLEAGVNMAQDWQKVCTTPAPGCDDVDAAKVAALRSPDEPDRDYAYEATSDKPSNMALVFDPDGRLVSKQVKTYLTPIELAGQLDLVPGDVMHGISAVDTPVGRLGFVISKDAWMPDVTERLDEEGVQILVQPEFFVNDTIRPTGPWAPDNIKGAGFSDVLRYPSMQALVMPQLTGNLLDLSADSQQAIVLKPHFVNGPRRAMVGQPKARGWAVVQPWVVRDPPSGSFAERRLRLGRAGLKLLPTSKIACKDDRTVGPCRGGQPEGVIWHDVKVGAPAWHPRPVRGSTRPLARSRGTQRNVALSSSAQLVVAAFEQDGRVLLARSTDGGRRWGTPSQPLTGTRQWWPSVSVRGNDVWLAAQVDDHVVWTRSADGGKTFERQHSVDSPAETWRPSIAATTAGNAYLAWIDTRDRFTLDDLPQAGLYGARLPDDAPQRLDSTAPPNDLARTLDNAWAPSVAAREQGVRVVWTDFRTYDWRIYARMSLDGGTTFGPEKAVTDTPPAEEALDASPHALAGSPIVAYTAWRKSGRSAHTPSPLYDIRIGAAGSYSKQVDGGGTRSVNAFSPAVAAGYVAWQDMARGTGAIWLARLSSPVRRKVVAQARRGNAWRPALAVVGKRAVVAWEDDRDGPPQIYARRMPLPFSPSRP
jgi:Carbon-nitrogen hydrolase